MRAGVGPTWMTFTLFHEGWAGKFYKDVKGLVSIGIGELADPMYNLGQSFLSGFVRQDGATASFAEVLDAWYEVKNDKTLDPKGGGGQYAKLTTVSATKEAITGLTYTLLARFEGRLKKYFPVWDTVPAHAQLAALSHAWAFGPDFPLHWPSYTAAFNAGKWDECAKQDMPSTAEWAAQNASFHDRITQEQAHLHACARFAAIAGSDPDDLDLPVAA